MNPLDLQEIPFIARDIRKEMPFHTPTTARIPNSFSQGLPKNLKELSNKRMNQYLNKHLSIIEEIEHRFPSHGLPKWMRQYGRKYYFTADILAHDNFFKIATDFEGRLKHRQKAGYFNEFGGKLIGATLTSGDTSANQNGSQNEIMGTLMPTGVLNSFYDQVAVNFQTAAGNVYMGVYNDSAGSPNTLYSQTASIAVATGFGLNSITEFQLNTTAVWSAFNLSSGSAAIYKNSSGTRKYDATAFASLPSTFSVTGSDSVNFNTKVAHS